MKALFNRVFDAALPVSFTLGIAGLVYDRFEFVSTPGFVTAFVVWFIGLFVAPHLECDTCGGEYDDGRIEVAR